MRTLIYDIECYYGLFLVVTLDITCPQSFIDAYIKADIAKNKALKDEILKHMPINIYMITKERNDLVKICNAFDENTLVIGFNNDSYDDTLINYLQATRKTIDVHGYVNHATSKFINGRTVYAKEHITTILKQISDEIINSFDFWSHPKRSNQNLKWFRQPYKSLDFFRCIFDLVNRKSLKQSLINSNWYRIQDLPIEPNVVIDNNTLINKIIDYCINDVLGLHHLFKLEGEEIGLRFTIGKQFGYNFLASNRANIADKLFINFYSEKSGIPVKELKDLRTWHTQIILKNYLSKTIHFDNPIFKELYERVSNVVYTYQQNQVKETVYLNGTGYMMRLGGMHSVDRVGYYNVVGTEMIIEDCDVGSYYPIGMLNEKQCPAHLNPDYYLPLGWQIVNDRLRFKAEGLITKATTYKLILNIELFGKIGANDSFLKDDAVKFAITLNGQFWLLMLVERLEAKGIHVISANTDGIVSYYPKQLRPIYQQICNDWCKELSFTLEYTPYEKYVRRDVNNYIAIKVGFYQAIKDGMDKTLAEKKYVKRKGFFDISVDIKKGYKTQIISKAVCDYYLYGTSPEETVKNCKNIYDFLIAQKVDKSKFNVVAHYVDEHGQVQEDVLQHSTRFYISKTGVNLTKKDKYSKAHTALSSHRYTTVFNDYIHYDDFDDYNVNINYYISAAYDVIYILNNVNNKGSKNVKQKYNSEQGLFG